MTDIPDIEKALDRFHETAEQLAEIEHFEGRVPGCDYEPIFKGSVDLLDARSLIAALRDERDAAIADRAAQAERMARLEEALRDIRDGRGKCKTCGTPATGGGAGFTDCDCVRPSWTPQDPADIAARALSQEGSDA